MEDYSGSEKINPYEGDSRRKGEQVRDMFNNIAPAYDFMNRMMTFGGIDRSWRRKAVGELLAVHPEKILDIATGTADLAIQLAGSAPYATITGIDLSEGMIEVGRRKVDASGLSSRITLEVGDCLSLPFPDSSFQGATVAFGVRNFEHLLEGYREIHRVLAPGGRLCVLELSTPRNPFVRPFYNLYTRLVIPAIGRLVSKDTRAYTYLPESIAAVAQGTEMLSIMRRAGFRDARCKSLTLGTCTLYIAEK